MNYEKMWQRLRDEFLNLENSRVRSVDPEIILAYMLFIEEVERVSKKEVE